MEEAVAFHGFTHQKYFHFMSLLLRGYSKIKGIPGFFELFGFGDSSEIHKYFGKRLL